VVEKNEQEELEGEWGEKKDEKEKTLLGANVVPMREISGPFANAAMRREANLASSSVCVEEEKKEVEEEGNNTLMGANVIQMREFSGGLGTSAAVQSNLTSSLETIFEVPINRNRETVYFDAKSNV
jgi:hypothetical protein